MGGWIGWQWGLKEWMTHRLRDDILQMKSFIPKDNDVSDLKVDNRMREWLGKVT